MDQNKSFICEDCNKSFTLKWNLKAHAKSCKGFGNKDMLSCEKCDGKFTSKRTLKVHSMKCFGLKTYSCKDCSETFVAYIIFMSTDKSFTHALSVTIVML